NSQRKCADMDQSKHAQNEMEQRQMDHGKMSHSAMNHGKMNHSAMDHGAMGAHAHHHHGSFKEIFLKSLPLGVAILLITPLMNIQLHVQIIFPYADVVAAVLATILYIFGVKPVLMRVNDEFIL